MKKTTKILIAILAAVLAVGALMLALLMIPKEQPKPGLNDLEKEKIANAVLALENSSYSGLDLANRIYIHAFTSGNFISLNITENTLAELAEGKASETVNGMVVPDKNLEDGDILLVDEKVYLYALGGLRDLNGTGAPKADTQAVLEGLAQAKQYAVLRPAYALPLEEHGDPAAEKDTLNEYQQAIVATAKAYLLRGEKLQYADTRLTEYGSKVGSEHRWHIRTNTPEDCTRDSWGYTNCAVFTYDVYYQALNYMLPDNMYTTSNMAKYAATNGTQVYCYERAKGSVQSEEEKAKVEQEFLSTLQPGDITVIRREDDSGHALLYVGNGDIIHSSGSIYNYKDGVEKYEASIRQVKAKDYFFNPTLSPRGYVFTNAVKLVILRPLNVFNGQIPAQTQNRVKNMQGIIAQKLCSHVRAQTVAPGEEMTFTYEIYNTNDREVTLEVVENLPEALTYLSGCDTVSGSKLTWTVTVPAGERAEVSYKAAVKEDTTYGTTIHSTESTVGGVTVKCDPVQVRGKLTPAQQERLLKTFALLREQGQTLTGLGLVNALYAQAAGIETAFADADFAAVTTGPEGCFVEHMVYNSKQFYGVNESGKYAGLIAPSLYGGYHLWTPEFVYDRTHLMRPQDLQIGDVLLCKKDTEETVLLYLGEEQGFVDVNTLQSDDLAISVRLEQLLAYDYYAVLRPAQALEDR